MKSHTTKGDKLYNVLLAPRVTEKTARVGEQGNQYVFRVATDATKADIRDAVEHLFDVNVESVQVSNVKGKTKSFRIGTDDPVGLDAAIAAAIASRPAAG